MPARLLVIRPDRLGDVVLTLPAVRTLRVAHPHAHLALLLAPGVAPLAPALADVDEVLVDPGGLFPLAGRLRDGRYDLALFPYGSARHVAAARLAGIRRRVGNGLRPYSLLLTDRVRVHRSRPPLHEVEYCRRLLEPLGIPAAPPPVPSLELPGAVRDRAGDLVGPEPFVVVHPGGGGSAGRPSPRRFGELARAARDAALPGTRILVSAGPGEEGQAREAAEAAGGELLPRAPDVLALAGLLSHASLVLAGSTGPLHLAAAAGAPVVGFYPRKASQTVERWGPQGLSSRAITPEVGGCEDCRAATCQAPACFERVPEDAVAAAATEAVGWARR